MGKKQHKTEGRKPSRDHAYFDRLDVQRHKRLEHYLDPHDLAETKPTEVKKTLRENPGSLKPIKKRKR